MPNTTDASESELGLLEKDMAASFEEFRRVEPGTYLAATSAASVLGAQMFVRRFLAWHHQQLEAKIADARKETLCNLPGPKSLLQDFAYQGPEGASKHIKSTGEFYRGWNAYQKIVADRIAHLTNNKTTNHEQEVE